MANLILSCFGHVKIMESRQTNFGLCRRTMSNKKLHKIAAIALSHNDQHSPGRTHKKYV